MQHAVPSTIAEIGFRSRYLPLLTWLLGVNSRRVLVPLRLVAAFLAGILSVRGSVSCLAIGKIATFSHDALTRLVNGETLRSFLQMVTLSLLAATRLEGSKRSKGGMARGGRWRSVFERASSCLASKPVGAMRFRPRRTTWPSSSWPTSACRPRRARRRGRVTSWIALPFTLQRSPACWCRPGCARSKRHAGALAIPRHEQAPGIAA